MDSRPVCKGSGPRKVWLSHQTSQLRRRWKVRGLMMGSGLRDHQPVPRGEHPPPLPPTSRHRPSHSVTKIPHLHEQLHIYESLKWINSMSEREKNTAVLL